MSRNGVVNIGILILAGIGLLTIAPFILTAAAGLSVGLVGLLVQVLVWMASGALAGRILRGRGYGFINDVLLGVIGGVVGTWLLRLVGLGGFTTGLLGGLFAGVVGAIVVVWVARQVR